MVRVGTIFLEQGMYTEAVESFDFGIQRNPYVTEPWNNRGVALHELGQYDEALASFEEAMNIVPGFSQSQNNLKLLLGGKYGIWIFLPSGYAKLN